MSSADVPTDQGPALPSQVSPPEFALSSAPPHRVAGVDVIALPVLPGEGDGGPVLGPASADVGDVLGLDLLRALEAAAATGEAGEVTTVPAPFGTDDSPDLACVLLVGVGRQRPQALGRAGAAFARGRRDRAAVESGRPQACIPVP